jgi:hypothetical protein
MPVNVVPRPSPATPSSVINTTPLVSPEYRLAARPAKPAARMTAPAGAASARTRPGSRPRAGPGMPNAATHDTSASPE